MFMADYSYQTHSANKIIKDIQKKGVEAAVLAASPSAGKTTISHIVISQYVKKFNNCRVLVLTHGQNLLKNQYIESLENPNVDINFTFGEFSSDAQVKIGLPQSIKKLDWEGVDLLVVDECHEFYLKKMVQSIVSKLKPRHQVLLTGSPSEFNRLKLMGIKYEITYISGNDLIKNDVFSTVEMNVVKIEDKKNVVKSLDKMISMAVDKKENMSKIMIAVNRIKDAVSVYDYLKSIGRKVVFSTNKNDRDSDLIKDFKSGKYDTLIVVQRGILGFSDNYITGIFDLRCSSDVDISNQLFARVLRKHPDGVKKFYYRCGNPRSKDFNNQVIMLHKIKALMKSDVFRNYDGTNMTVRIS